MSQPTNNAIAAAVAPVAAALSDAAVTCVTVQPPEGTFAVKSFDGSGHVSMLRQPPTQPSWYAVNRLADAEGEAEVMIYDVIGAFGISASQFVRDLKDITAKRIRLRLNTPGGELFDATAIYNAIQEHPATIIVHVDGVAASAGSVIAMAGNEVRMADNAYMMIHNGHGGAYGEAEDMRRYADLLDKANDNIAGIYHQKAGKGKKHWRDLMSAETWFTAAEAKAEGLVDVVDKPAKAAPAKASFDFKMYNQAKIPDPVRRLWNLSPTASAPVITEPTQPTTPEAPPRGDTPPTDTKETTPMADTATTAAPAQTPAAGTSENQQGTPTNQDHTINQMSGAVMSGYLEQARKTGFDQGLSTAMERFNAIVAVCPGKPQMAVTHFVAGQDANTAKLAFDAAAEADARTLAVERAKAEEISRLQGEISRLNALASFGGHVGVNFAPADGRAAEEPVVDAKAQAEQEWDFKPAVRKGFASKENYVNFRKNELEGRIHYSKA